MEIFQPTSRTELEKALAVLVRSPGQSGIQTSHQVDALVSYATRKGLSLDNCLAARDGTRIVASCLCVDAPGRSSGVYLPTCREGDPIEPAFVELLNEAADLAARRGIQFLQALIPPEDERSALLFEQAAFSHLARLQYMEGDVVHPLLANKQPRELSWETYGPATHSLFAETVKGTYEGSLDCASLNDRRDIEDILANHKAAGEFDPSMWFLAQAEGTPVGALLLTSQPQQAGCEVVYVGLVPAFRGQGYGASLLLKAFRTARETGAAKLRLAVDDRNTPARRLYERFGMARTIARDAWIRFVA